jgi:tRNA (guanine-N7-)-methyltransferase
MSDNDLVLKPEFKDKSIRSFVIRAGRITDGQKKAFDAGWREYGLSLFSGRQNWAEVFGRSAPLVVEVGFGMGDSLLQMCMDEPDKNFIGIEVHPPGVGRLMNNAQTHGLNNLKVYMADANDVLEDCFSDQSIDRFQLYFPDPWHKKKHNKRRIVQADFIKLVAQKMTFGGVCHMATDWQEYAEQMLEELSSSTAFTNCSAQGDYCEKPEFRPETKFERRGERLGHGVWDLLFTRVSS